MQETLVRYIAVARNGYRREGIRKFTIEAFKKHFPEIKLENLRFDKGWYSKEQSDNNFEVYFDLVNGDRNECDVVTEEVERLF